tara:strand:- start:4631 stop:5371 length:741 start_codon:yes stop_codon:yes gene_type:complete
MNAIDVKNLTVSYDKNPVIRSISASIKPKQVVGVIGPNGAGKSTFLKAIMGLLQLDSGSISVFGENISKARDKVAYVPQRSEIDWDFPVIVRDVVMMGRYKHLGWVRKPKKEDHKIVDESLQQLGMQDFSERQIGELSGGQQQRVFLARALAQQTDILMLDEPFVGVDAATENSILDLMGKLKDVGKTIVVVNHDLSNVVKRYDSLMLINQRLVAYGKTKDVFKQDIINKAYGGRLTLLEEVQAKE